MNPNLKFLRDNIATKRIIGLQGSTRSGKSYSVSQFIISLCAKHSGMTISICRDTFNALKATTMRDYFDLLTEAGIYDPRSYNATDHIYYHNGNIVEFFGLDAPGKVQGRKRHILFVDEAIEANWDVVKQLKLRTSHRIIYAFNPSLIQHPIYAELERDDACKIITTYLDNIHNLTPEQVREIELLKDTDPELWRIYGEGLPARARNTVYTHYTIQPYTKPDEFVYGLDVGFEHPMALIEVGKVGQSIQWHEVIYQKGITTSDLLRIMDGKVSKRHAIYVDSARPDVITELLRAGYIARGANKSVIAGINAVKSKPLQITSQSVNLQREAASYRYNPNQPDVPIKADDDGMDAGRYGHVGLCGFGAIKAPRLSIPSDNDRAYPL